jgi:hypothetical protein
MKRGSLLPLIVAASICSILLGFSPSGFAATATNLVTICTSATMTIQASKCTAWQYNVYSPTAYLESYPQVSPGPKGYTDPLYEYRLGSSITSTMGVKVCPTALVPGTSFNSPQADPCPNNVLVSASTVLGHAEYVITVTANGIEVTQNWNGASVPVAGSPFVENPLVYLALEEANPPAVVSPTAMALDPAGAYLYAYYNTDGDASYYYSFAVESNGSLKQVASLESANSPCAFCNADISVLTASAHYVAVYVPQNGGYIFLMSTKSGVMTTEGSYSTINYLPDTANVTSIQIDASEQWMYVNYSSTGGAVADTAIVYNMQQLPSSLVYVSNLAVGTGGIQIVP